MLFTRLAWMSTVGLVGIALTAGACGGPTAIRSDMVGAAGAGATGAAGTTGAAGSVGDSGNAGATGAAGSMGDSGNAGATGAAGSTGDSGNAGSSGNAGGSGLAGSTGIAGSTGRGGAGGATGAAGATAGAGGKPDGGAAGTAGSDAGPPLTDGGVPSKILIYCVTTGFHHASIPTAATAIATVMKSAHGVDADQVSCDGKIGPPDPTKFTPTALTGYGAVVLLANSGLPFGGTTMGKTEIDNLSAFVKNGGGLVAIEDADHCYDGAFGDFPNQTYINLIGNDFGGHSGNGPATCRRADTDNNPSVAQLPTKVFAASDEIYGNKAFNPLNNVVLKCTSSGGTEHIISYTREKTADTGNGRVFYTALGHNDVEWTAPLDPSVANTRLTEDHVVPALLWTMHRL